MWWETELPSNGFALKANVTCARVRKQFALDMRWAGREVDFVFFSFQTDLRRMADFHGKERPTNLHCHRGNHNLRST
jgi:hypothetical protein